jgi:hypothetical protein
MKAISVDDIDRARREHFTRSPDRPSGRMSRRDKQPPALIRAKTRLRTAAWRRSLDDRKCPEANTVAIAFLVSVARATDFENLRDQGIPPAFAAMLTDMIERGYDPKQVMAVVRRVCRADRRARQGAK